jgi:glycosyltransferase involved in cell wall biosynthesis
MSRRLVLVLGPHRTGTSVAAAALPALGADPRLETVYTNAENAKGFFEHPQIVAFDDRVLARIGTSWDDPGCDGAARLAAAGLDDGRLDDLVSEGAALIDAIFANTPLGAVKDPRICLLLPLWARILTLAGYRGEDILQLHVTRDPYETARSQMLRQRASPDFYDIGQTMAEGAVLWLGHAGQALDALVMPGLAGGPAVMIRHADVLADPGTMLDRIAAAFGLPVSEEARADFAGSFVDRTLYRSKVTPEERAAVAAALPMLPAFASALDALACGPLTAAAAAPARGLFRAEDTRRTLVAAAAGATGRLSDRLRKTGLALRRMADELHVAQTEIDEIRTDRDRMATSFSAEMAQLVNNFTAELERTRADTAAELERTRTSAAAELERTRTSAASEIEQLNDRIGTATSHLAHLQAEANRRDHHHARTEKELRQRIDELMTSNSWRITAPLRGASLSLHALGRGPRRAWLALNGTARDRYRRMAAEAPDRAARLRRLLWPVLRLGNRHILGKDYVPLVQPTHAPDGTALARLDYQSPCAETPFTPHVTVIVPNYNHAPYLRQRLDSVYAQDYPAFDVILMDDCSSDDSRTILADYAARHADRTTLLLNDTNSGGAFFQWEKGIRAAKGDLIWIAESDDWADPDFLSRLVPFFRNEAVMLAYGRTHFMDAKGEDAVWSMDYYLADLGADRWHHPWVAPAPKVVAEALGLRNIIPNVSSAVFRRPDSLDALGAARWRGMRTCGDWMFYLNLIRGGLLAYSPAARNYYRQHAQNTSVRSHVEDRYWREHETVATEVASLYRVDPAIFDRMRATLVSHWKLNREGFDEAAFSACFDTARIRAAIEARRPNVLMVGYSFAAGGGETFAAGLATEMKREGFTVTYLDCAQEARQPGIRTLLSPDIPVVSNLSDLLRIVEDFDIGIVHSHHAWVDNSVLDILPEDSPAAQVVTLHGMYETILPADLDRIVPRMLRRTGRFVTIADKNIGPFVSRGADLARFVHIDNALSPKPAGALSRADLGLPEDAFVLTLVSRAIPPKGWDEGIAAVARARAISGRDIRLVLVGNGAVHDRLAANPGLPAFVTLRGFQSDTRAHFAASDMGFLPSRFEGESFPLVLIECLQSGRPMIASAIGEIPRMLRAGPDGALAGDLQPLENWQVPVEDLAARIAAFVTDPARLAAAMAAVPAAAAKFDPLRMRREYGAVYLAAAGHGGNGALS